MDRPLHFTWNIYMHKFEKILVLMLLTTLPILLFHSVVTNYMYAVSAQGDTAYLFADLFYALLTLIFYLYAQIPFIRFVYNEHQGIENSLRNALYHFFGKWLYRFCFCLYCILVKYNRLHAFGFTWIDYISVTLPDTIYYDI